MKKPIQYVNNNDMVNALIAYKKECADSIAKGGSPRPNTKNYRYIGQCFMLIAQKLTNSGNFYSYSYKDDFVADAILVCVERMGNFNPEIKDQHGKVNAFAYFTQLCWFASVARIKTEHKQKDIKCEIIKNSNIIETLSDNLNDVDDGQDIGNMVQYLLSYIDKPKDTIDKKHKKTTKLYQKKLKELDEIAKTYDDALKPIDELESLDEDVLDVVEEFEWSFSY